MDELDRLTDERLLTLSAGGDREAFALLVARHQDFVYGLARRYLGSRALAEEAAQEVFLRLWRAAPRYRPLRPLGAYLRTLTVRVCLDGIRAARVPLEPLPEGGGSLPAGAASEEALLLEEHRRALAEALAGLPPSQRMAVVLFHLQGLSVQETAELLSVSPKAAESLLSRARRALKDRLAGLLR